MAKVKRGLGKGLDALIPQNFGSEEVEKIANNKEIYKISIDEISPNRNQPRKAFDKDRLKALENSIKEHGIIQPLLLRKIDKGYEIVAGERRWRAAKNLKMKMVPVVIKELNEKATSEIALIENLQREDLNSIEEAMAYKSLVEDYFLTQERLSKLVGKSRPYIANTIRLLKLDQNTIKSITDKKISGGHGRALLSIEELSVREKILESIISNDLSVREVEKIVTKLNKDKSSKPLKIKNHELLEIENKLSEFLGTKISIKEGKSKSKIEVEYYNDEDLNRILEILKI